MIDEKLVKKMQSGTGCVVVMAGSDSDQPHIEEVIKGLDKYNLPHEVRICSAHKQPEELKAMIDEYNAVGGTVVYIAIAGGTDALSGTLSFHAMGPVVSCPPDAPNATCLTNPPGSSNAYVARAANAARFAAQVFAGANPSLRKILEDEIGAKRKKLEEKDKEFRAKYRSLGEGK